MIESLPNRPSRLRIFLSAVAVLVLAGVPLAGQQPGSHAGEHAGHHEHTGHHEHAAADATATGGDHAEHDHDHHASTGVAQEVPIEPQIPDPILIDQFGNEHHFYTDLIEGNLVLMNSVYTSCAGTCPVQTAIFKRVQQLLGDRVGRDVQMISVSLDPVTDTPERLKAFAEQHQAGPGWLFLTGDKQDVTLVLQAMDLYSAVPEDHTPIASIGNEPAKLWMKVINLSAPREIVSRLDHLVQLGEQRATAAAANSE